jgi:predicted amidohydrolase YtcJ
VIGRGAKVFIVPGAWYSASGESILEDPGANVHVPPRSSLRAWVAWALTICVVMLTAPTAKAQEPVDQIVTNGVIYTMDPKIPRAEAMAISSGRIVAVGTTREIGILRGSKTEVEDLGGRVIIPGLIDAHAHVIKLGFVLRVLDLRGTSSADEIAEMVQAVSETRAAEEWITGRGWDQNDWAVQEFPTRELLDQVTRDDRNQPVYLTRVDGHAAWVNSRALELAEVTADTPDPDGGKILRDDDGEPTGVLVDNAMALVFGEIPAPDAVEYEARLEAAQNHLLSLGVTGVHTMGDRHENVETYHAWAAAGKLKPRIVVYVDSDEVGILDWLAERGGAAAFAGPHLRVAGVKHYSDGALGSRGAALLAPYSDDPDNSGLLVTHPDTLAAEIAQAFGLGLQSVIHAIGDRGNREALEAIAAAFDAPPPVQRDIGLAWKRPRIEHAQVLAIDDIDRFVELGVIASMQPTHATSDMYWAEDRVGPDRIRGAYAWRKLRRAGVHIACGSDFPVESANPFYGLYAAVTRQDREGWPAGGWYPEERMTREEALACFTRDAAYAAGMEAEVGTLSPGKWTDYLLLDRDLMLIPDDDLWRVEVLRTVIGGEVVYEAPWSESE